MAFLSSLNIGGSALTAQRLRMDIISENLAKADVTRTDTGEPYRRQLTVFREASDFTGALESARRRRETRNTGNAAHTERSAAGDDFAGVVVSEVIEDQTPFTPVYDPTDPDADAEGYVYMPNVDTAKEQIDLLAATRSYDANMTAVNAVKAMAQRALQIGQ